MGHEFDTCPARVVMNDGRLVAALALEAESAINPLSNWPEGYSAWSIELLGDIRRARQKRERAVLESSRKTISPR